MPSKFGIKSFCRNSGWLGWNSNGFWNLERVKQCAGFLPPCITTNSIWSSVLGLFDFIGFPNTLRQIQNRPQTFTTYKFLKITQAKIRIIQLKLRIPISFSTKFHKCIIHLYWRCVNLKAWKNYIYIKIIKNNKISSIDYYIDILVNNFLYLW